MLYHLASKPEYVQAMRKEVESVVRKEGWTRSAMAQLNLLDSFIRESQVRRAIQVFEHFLLYLISNYRGLTGFRAVRRRFLPFHLPR
jgi:Cytochrome P450